MIHSTKENLTTVPEIQQMLCQYEQLLDIHVDDSVVMKKLEKRATIALRGSTVNTTIYPKGYAQSECVSYIVTMRAGDG